MASESPSPAPYRWKPIEDLPEDRSALERAVAEVAALRRAWRERKRELEASGALTEFNRRLVRSWCIETGVIEGIYSVSRGVTQTLIERGFDTALVSHGDSDIPAPQLIAILKDHEQAVEGLFAFVKQERTLSTSYIKELHQVLTAHQETCDAVDQFGTPVKVELLRGAWKKLPNNPSRGDTLEPVHEYCPPEHVDAEMDRLVAMHAAHGDVEPEISAAWLHHRFTQIHPFQDGNGRVARALATLVLIRAHGFPLVVARDDKRAYIDALRAADEGEVLPVVELFAGLQRKSILAAMSEGDSAITTSLSLDDVLADIGERLTKEASARPDAIWDLARQLRDRAAERFNSLGARVREALAGIGSVTVICKVGDGPRYADRATTAAAAIGLKVDPALSNWAELRIDHGRLERIILAVHPVEGSGERVLAALVFVVLEAGGTARVETASREPFTFTVQQPRTEVVPRFQSWLEESLKLAVLVWRRSL